MTMFNGANECKVGADQEEQAQADGQDPHVTERIQLPFCRR